MRSMLVLGTALVAALGGDDREAAQAIRIAYQANRERVAQGQARFETAEGDSSSIEAARRGELGDAAIARGSYALASGQARLERVYPLGVMAEGTRVDGKHIRSSARSVRCLTDGKNSLIDEIGAWIDSERLRPVDPPREKHLVRIEPGLMQFYKELEFPLRPGHPEGDLDDLAVKLGRALAHEDGWELVSLELDSTYEGTDASEVVLKRGDTTWTYWVELDRGAIPRRSSSVNPKKKRSMTLCYDDIREVADGVYLPFHQTMRLEDGTTRTVKLVSFEPRPPPEAAFALHFEEPVDGTDHAHNVRLAARKAYRLSDLRGAIGPRDRRMVRVAGAGASAVPEMPGELEPWPRWVPWLALATLTAIAAGVWAVVRGARWR